jgi:flagellar basal-body rod modification protein FlgD
MTDLATINELFPPRNTDAGRGASSVEELGSDAFLELMVAQLENQDPSKPIENGEFVAQLAQFGTVSGIQDLNEGFSSLSASLAASQGWQAAGLVGRGVVADSNVGQLRAAADGEEGAQLQATIDFRGNPSGGTFYVQDLTGRLVYSAPLPAGVEGELQVAWDGRDESGELMPEGSYRVSAETQSGGQNRALPVYAHQQVVSVAIDSSTGAVTLNLGDGSKVPVNQIRQFL